MFDELLRTLSKKHLFIELALNGPLIGSKRLEFPIEPVHLFGRGFSNQSDPIFWLFAAPGLLLGFYAQSLIKSNHLRYSQVPTQGGITGAQVASRMS